MKRQSTTAMLRQALQLLLRDEETRTTLQIAFSSYRRPHWNDGGGARQGRVEALTLKTLNHDSALHQRINERAKLKAMIDKLAKDGKVGVVESGMDCDCVQYSGKVRVIDAHVAAYELLYRETAEWADGPFHFTLAPPDVDVEYRSVDRAMEAYEDGHPHHVVMGAM
jgi:hypothetical protein